MWNSGLYKKSESFPKKKNKKKKLKNEENNDK